MTPLQLTDPTIQKLFGHEAAEDEDAKRLREYYFKSTVYDRITADLPVRVLVGHKGIGKSALLKVAIAENTEKSIPAILIQPNDILDLGIETLDFLHTIRSWTEGLAEIIVRKTISFFGMDSSKLQLNQDHGKSSIVDRLVATLLSIDTRQYPEGSQSAIFSFLESPKICVYVDDLDRGWQGRKEDVTRISALLNAVRDLSNANRGVFFKVALRSDVYYLVRTSDESTDKIEGSVVWHMWSNHEIFVMLIKRIETFFGRAVTEAELLQMHQSELARYLAPVMEPRFTGRGHWAFAPTYRVLMSLIRKRPRDLVKLCTLAAEHAHMRKSPIIETQDLEAVFGEYSQGRIQDTINEYRSELSSLERLVMGMRPNRRERTAKAGYVYKTDALLGKIAGIVEQGRFSFANGNVAEPKDLAAFLYKINFLTARKETPNGIIRKYFEENRYLSSQFVDFGFDWEVHPAYRWALQPTDINEYLPVLSVDDQ